MGKSEPTLVPEWLKNSGNSGRSLAHSDDHGQSKLTRNRSFANNKSSNGRDFGRSFSSDRTTSSYFLRSSSSNGSGNIRHHSSSNRSPRDREWEKDRYKSNDREKTLLGERWRRDSSDSPKSTPLTRFDRDGLRHSQSMVSGKRGDTWHKKVPNDSDDYGGKSKNGSPTKNSPIGGAKTNFEREYPSLGLEERVVTSDVRRVSSPMLSSVTQSFPISMSTAIGGEKWTSALAEVPGLVVSSGTSGSSSSQHVTVGTSASINMAEAVGQGPCHAQTVPQFSAGTQRFEDLSLKQFRQLISVTPVLPKALNKAGQLQNISPSSLPHSPLGGPVNGEVSKAKLHILKPVREHNGVQTPTSKDKLSSTIGTKPVTSALAPSSDHKAVPTVLEKRPTSQARSRNDFFNSVRNKSMANTYPPTSNPLSVSDNVAVEPPCFPIKADSEPVCIISGAMFNVGSGLDRGHDSNLNVDTNEHHLSNGMEQAISDLSIPDEKEAAFLRSLGWEEDSDEGGLTEEEINAFFRDAAKYMVSKPTPLNILKDLQPKNTSNSQVLGIDGISSARSPLNGKLH